MQTLTFKEGPGYQLQADIYLAAGAKLGTLLYIHGGALIWGSRTSIPTWQVEYYTEQGFDFVSIDYRKAPETKLPEIMADVRDGLTWVQEHGAEHGLNTEQIFVLGRSAGGYLALMTGCFTNPPDAIVSFYGYGDTLADWYSKPSPHFLQKPRIGREEAYQLIDGQLQVEGSLDRYLFYLYCRQHGRWSHEVSGFTGPDAEAALAEFCPQRQATESFPPTLLLHGTSDLDVPYQQSVLMDQRLQALGVPCRLVTLLGKGHDFDEVQDDPKVEQSMTEVVNFLTNLVPVGAAR